MNKIAVILIRGLVNVSNDNKKTLEYLRLMKKHSCVVVDGSETNLGMIKKVKDYITYGTIDEGTFKEMIEKRGELVGMTKVKDVKEFKTDEVVKKYFKGEIKLRDFELKYDLKPFFRLHPPIKGFEREGIKRPFGNGGVLGDRKEKIKELILKML